MGVEKASFGGLAFALSFLVVAKFYWAMGFIVIAYLLMRWLTKRDGQFMAVFFRYLNEDHIYDATPRTDDFKKRPKGWGRGIPL